MSRKEVFVLGDLETDVGLKAKLFRGLGDRSRLSILESLADGTKNVSELVEETGLTQPNVSMHLDCLFCCGLVTRERRGRFVYYEVKSRRTKQLRSPTLPEPPGPRIADVCSEPNDAVESVTLAGIWRSGARGAA
ncbi:MAG: ArsR/SmtB family transcription factor, partial [Dehalococcoidia bacterium]